MVEVETPLGQVPVKVAGDDGEPTNAAPEYEVCRKLARDARGPGEKSLLGRAGCILPSLIPDTRMVDGAEPRPHPRRRGRRRRSASAYVAELRAAGFTAEARGGVHRRRRRRRSGARRRRRPGLAPRRLRRGHGRGDRRAQGRRRRRRRSSACRASAGRRRASRRRWRRAPTTSWSARRPPARCSRASAPGSRWRRRASRSSASSATATRSSIIGDAVGDHARDARGAVATFSAASRESVGWTRAALMLLTDERRQRAPGLGVGRSVVDEGADQARRATRRCAPRSSRASRCSSRTPPSSALLGEWAELAAEKGGRALLAVPLLVERKVAGVLLLRNYMARPPLGAARDRFSARGVARCSGWSLQVGPRLRGPARADAAACRCRATTRSGARARSSSTTTSSRRPPTAWWCSTPTAAILYVNRAAEQITGYAREGLDGRRLHRAGRRRGAARRRSRDGRQAGRRRRATSRSFDLAARRPPRASADGVGVDVAGARRARRGGARVPRRHRGARARGRAAQDQGLPRAPHRLHRRRHHRRRHARQRHPLQPGRRRGLRLLARRGDRQAAGRGSSTPTAWRARS